MSIETEEILIRGQNPWKINTKIKISVDGKKEERNDMEIQRYNRKKVIALLNCSIMTGIDGIYTSDTIGPSAVKKELDDADIIISAIGHESTAKIMTELLGIEVPVNPIKYEQLSGEVAIVFQLNSRPPEGKILTYKEIEKIGYTWKRIEKYNRNPFG